MVKIKKQLIQNYQKRKQWYGHNKFQDQAEIFEIETARAGVHKNWILKWIAYGLRDFIQLLIGYLYYGENIPLDPNLTIVMGHVSKGE
ncbi:MAG: hypothetical protein PF503_19855 [Desulfobacula sp.]|nr:hypothetical protein [Desulfobacula sp.]